MQKQYNKGTVAFAVFSILMGAFSIIRSMGFLPGDNLELETPNVIVALVGFAFIIAGSIILVKHQSRVYSLLAAILCLVFAIVSAWVALFSPSDEWYSNYSFVTHDVNVFIARVMSGIGALMLFAMADNAFKSFRI